MKSTRGRSIACLSAVTGVAVLAAASYQAKDLAIEEWHFWKLRSESREKQDRALAIITMLGPRAAAAAPALVQELKLDRSRPVLVVDALVAIGPAAVPVLVAALQPDPRAEWVPYTALEILTRLGPKAEDAVPALEGALADEERSLRIGACHALGSVGAEARASLPALKKALGDKDWVLREAAARAIVSIEREPPLPPGRPPPGHFRIDGR